MPVAGITVDVCTAGCGGLWFDKFELKKVDEAHESEGEILMDIEAAPDIAVDHSRRRSCPKCEGQLLRRHFFNIKREVEVDECPACSGIWLDKGELSRIRAQYGTEQERRAAVSACYDELLAENLKPMRDKTRADRSKGRRIARIFRFLCPSYYIPGDQAGGAF